MAMVYNYLIMEIIIKANIKWVDFMVKVVMFGKMVHHMMVILYKDVVKEQVDGNLIKLNMIYILGSIKVIKNQEKDNIHGIMVQFIKDNLLMI